MSPIRSLFTWEGPERGGLGSSEAWPSGKAGVETQEQLTRCPWGPLPSLGQLWAPKRPCPLPGLGTVKASSLSRQGISWDQGSFWSKLPLESRDGLQALQGLSLGFYTQLASGVI